jgi:nitroimidazol reductase NimA-like FMN-containing flavoprotein (pyridoxamine 5'-phosphate oxidase superfamily)
MTTYRPTPRTTLRRVPARGTYDRAEVHAILDEALVCTVGFAIDGQPYVIPTTFVREGESLYLHGAAASRMLRCLADGVPACVTVTLLDGLVLARSAFHHSMNYRSVVALGVARNVPRDDEKRHALGLLVDKISPGRSASVRAPNEKELRATSVLSMPLAEASAKVRRGPPLDDAEDMDLHVWAGVVPVAPRAGPRIPDGHPSGVHAPPELPLALRCPE